jgi:hypothetical protein
MLESYLFQCVFPERGANCLVRTLRSTTGRIRGGVSALSAWDCLEKAKSVFSCSESNVLEILSLDNDAFKGLAKRNGLVWARKELCIHAENFKDFHPLCKINLQADASVYSGQDSFYFKLQTFLLLQQFTAFACHLALTCGWTRPQLPRSPPPEVRLGSRSQARHLFSDS